MCRQDLPIEAFVCIHYKNYWQGVEMTFWKRGLKVLKAGFLNGTTESVLTITYFFNVLLFSSQLGHLSSGRSDESSVIHNNSLMMLPNSPFAAVSLAAECMLENKQNAQEHQLARVSRWSAHIEP